MATWTVSTYYKKSCEEHEHFTKDDQTIIRKTGFRGATFIVETNDDNTPKFKFNYVPGGDGKLDSINMYDCCENNIEHVELDNMWDGCWEDIDFPEDMDEEEQERLMELINEEGVYTALEENDGWTLDESEAWIWGPILIEDEAGNRVKIVCADEQGNLVDFIDDTPVETTAESNLDNDWPFPEPKDESVQDITNSMPVWPFPIGIKDNK